METATPIPVVPVIVDEEKKLLLSWRAPSRPFKKRDKEFFTTIVTLAILLGIILLFMREFMLIAAIGAIVFVVIVLGTVPPEDIDNEIYNTGLRNGDHFYPWAELFFFYFEERWGRTMLVARTQARLPGAVYMLLNDSVSKEKVEELIGTRLVYKKTVEATWMDRAAKWLQDKIPLERSSK